MATTIMRDFSVSSPVPAGISPLVTDENQNGSLTAKTTAIAGITKDVSDHSDSSSQLCLCKYCDQSFSLPELLENHQMIVHKLHDSPMSEISNKMNCSTSNTSTTESPTSCNSKSESFESDDFDGNDDKRIITNRPLFRDDIKQKSDSDSDSNSRCPRKLRSVNNNYSDDDYQCSLCNREFNNWNTLKVHLESHHSNRDPYCDISNLKFDSQRVLNLHRFMMHNNQQQTLDNVNKHDPKKQLHTESTKCRVDRKHLKNVPKVIGFQDINFIDFSSEKFPLVAKDVCEKSLHLSKDEFCFYCHFCGRGFPCSSALDIHVESCENKKKTEEKCEKKNKRKSTPKFRPQALTSDDSNDSTDNNDIDNQDKQRNNFFHSLDLCNTGLSSKSSSIKSEDDKVDHKPDLADIQSMISVTNIPGIHVKDFSSPSDTSHEKNDDKPLNLNLHISTQSSPSSYSTSPSFSVMNLISPNYSTGDPAEEEAQDCFAAECRRMKLRGEFPCKLCTAVFPNLRALKGHNRVHISVANGTLSSPYRCNICTYNSLDKATLVRHMRSHNGDRPYQCAMCNYAFTTKANCERHLRNRHSKMTRDDVKSSIIYHPSEDPVNDADYQKTISCNKKSVEELKEKSESSIPVNLKMTLNNLREKPKPEDLFQVEHQELLKNISNTKCEDVEKSEVIGMTEHCMSAVQSEPDEDEALDLRVNKRDSLVAEYEYNEPEDLSKKSNDEYNNNVIKMEVKDNHPQSYDQKPDMGNLIKFYSNMYPTLTLAQIHQLILTQFNFPGLLQQFHNLSLPSFVMPESVFHGNNLQKSFLSKEALGLQMSGGSIMDEKSNFSVTQKFQAIQQQALAEILLKREKDRIANNFYHKSHDAFEKPLLNSTDYLAEADKKTYQEIIENRESRKLDIFPIKSYDKTIDNRNTSVKMVIKNGVLMPKQKQRRYRTERPFSCEHCSARFTLRSNMERHIKQQHPQHWTHKSRYNVGNRKSEGGKYSLEGEFYKSNESPKSNTISGNSLLERDRSPDRNLHETESDLENEEKGGSDEEESKDDLIIDEGSAEREHIRMLANVSEYLKSKQSAEVQVHEVVNGQPQDLASVSKMLDNAVTQTQAFQKYFQEEIRRDDDESKREDGDRSEEEEGLIAGSTSSDENRSETDVITKSTKKKSAYSLAPNRVSCPYCFRKFPWTSSLRRHVLTHTGQKPFKCTHCPLLFTTKSNCDRHLLRKHGREALIASNGQTENPEGANVASDYPAGTPFSMRNVPERPFKCNHCPASTFSSLNALSKHISCKHSSDVLSSDGSASPERTRLKNLNPRAPPNVTISPNFSLNIPKALSIIPQYSSDQSKSSKSVKGYAINVPSVRVSEWQNSIDCDEQEYLNSRRKRSSSDETEAPDRKRTSPDLIKTSGGEFSDPDHSRQATTDQLPPIPPSELPFKCHLCEGSFGERNEALDHIRLQHPTEFQLLMSKGALENNSEEDRLAHDDHDDGLDSTRGKFPDYANRKVMCAFCMRRFWSAEDLRRHMRTHTGERPFSCDVCHRRFTLKHSMLRHRKKHTTADEIIVGSDEEHHNNNLPYLNMHKSLEGEEYMQRTILHKTLTRHEDEKEKRFM